MGLEVEELEVKSVSGFLFRARGLVGTLAFLFFFFFSPLRRVCRLRVSLPFPACRLLPDDALLPTSPKPPEPPLTTRRRRARLVLAALALASVALAGTLTSPRTRWFAHRRTRNVLASLTYGFDQSMVGRDGVLDPSPRCCTGLDCLLRSLRPEGEPGCQAGAGDAARPAAEEGSAWPATAATMGAGAPAGGVGGDEGWPAGPAEALLLQQTALMLSGAGAMSGDAAATLPPALGAGADDARSPLSSSAAPLSSSSARAFPHSNALASAPPAGPTPSPRALVGGAAGAGAGAGGGGGLGAGSGLFLSASRRHPQGADSWAAAGGAGGDEALSSLEARLSAAAQRGRGDGRRTDRGLAAHAQTEAQPGSPSRPPSGLGPDPSLGLGSVAASPSSASSLPPCLPSPPRRAVVTYIRSAAYLPLLRQLECTLHQSNPSVPLVLMLVPGELDPAARAEAGAIADEVEEVEALDFENSYEPRYGKNWLKLRAWNLTRYDAVALVDADAVVVGPLDGLWLLPTDFAAVWDQSRGPFSGRTKLESINGGVLFLRPCPAVAAHMLTLARDRPKLRFARSTAEQAFLSWYYRYSGWTLPLEYNAMASQSLSKRANGTLTVGGVPPIIVHFSGASKDVFEGGLGSHLLCSERQLAQSAADRAHRRRRVEQTHPRQ